MLSGERTPPTTVPPALHDRVARVGFERGAECVIGGDEEEAVELLAAIRRRISATPFDQLSAFHWMPFGEQALPVRSEDEAESKMTSRLRALARS